MDGDYERGGGSVGRLIRAVFVSERAEGGEGWGRVERELRPRMRKFGAARLAPRW